MNDDNKLTPLTDPSVRGVLVDDGEPTNQLKEGCLYIAGDLLFRSDSDDVDNSNWQPVKLRPASEFGVAARGEPGLKKLPEEWTSKILRVLDRAGEYRYVLGMLDELEQRRRDELFAALDAVPKEHPATLGIPDGGERIKELEAELARRSENHHRAENECIASGKEVERLRKACDEARRKLDYNTSPLRAIAILDAALSPSPAAASGEKLEPSMLPVSSTSKVVSRDSDYRRPTSAPAAESQPRNEGPVDFLSAASEPEDGEELDETVESEGGQIVDNSPSLVTQFYAKPQDNQPISIPSVVMTMEAHEELERRVNHHDALLEQVHLGKGVLIHPGKEYVVFTILEPSLLEKVKGVIAQ